MNYYTMTSRTQGTHLELRVYRKDIETLFPNNRTYVFPVNRTFYTQFSLHTIHCINIQRTQGTHLI